MLGVWKDINIDEESVNTLPKVLRYQYRKYGDKEVFMSHKDFGIWNNYTWKDVYEHTALVHLGLLSLGLEPEDVVGIIGDNDPRWFWAEYAIQAAKAITVGMYVDYHYAEVKYVLGFGKAKFAFAKDQEMVDKIVAVKEFLPNLKKVIYWEARGLWFYDFPWLMSYDELEEMGREYKKSHPNIFEENIDKTQPDDIACTMLSSGTTRMTDDGVPRSQMGLMTHRALMLNATGVIDLAPVFDNDKYVSYASPAWGEQYIGVGGNLITATHIFFPEKPATIANDIREIGPQSLSFTPRLWEAQISGILSRIEDSSSFKRFFYDRFLPIGYKMVDYRMKGKRAPLWLRLLYKLGDLIVFRPMRDQLGLLGVRHAYNAGAVLGPDSLRFFHAIGVPLKQIYGTTEIGLHCLHPAEEMDYETVGKIISLDYIKISDEGEILFRGPMLGCGYLNDPEAWKKNFDEEGWFHTGDSGYINERGHLVFYDRLSDMVKLPTGRKFSPQYVESRLKFSTYIRDCVIIGGEDKPFVSSIITVDYENAGDWAEKHHIPYTTYVDLSQKPQIYDIIKEEVRRVNEYLADDMKIKKLVNLHKEFDADDAELTRSGKIRRKYMEERYSELVEAIYSGKDKYETEASVKYRDGRTGTIRTFILIKSVED